MRQVIDNSGRVLIPKPYRKDFDLENGDMVEISIEDKRIIITPVVKKKCIVCSTPTETEVCSECIIRIKNQIKNEEETNNE